MSLFNHPSKLVQKVDPSLTYCSILGEGGFGIVYLVSAIGRLYALKVSKWKEEVSQIGREFHILQKLKKVEGIPEPVHFYPRAIIDDGSNYLGGYLMQYVQSRNVTDGIYPGVEFFRRLRDIGNQVADRGYTLPSDLDGNVLVDAAKKPWVIDFMLSKYLDIDEARLLNKKLINKLEDTMICMSANKSHVEDDIIFPNFLERAL